MNHVLAFVLILLVLPSMANAELTLVGSYDIPGGRAYGVAVVGNYAYVTDGFLPGMRIFDIENPASPIQVGSLSTPSTALDVEVAGGYAYVTTGYTGLRIIDVSNPANPLEVAYYDTPGNAYGVTVAGNYAYVADDISGGLAILDISNPASPVLIGSHDTPGWSHEVAVAGNYAYVADLTNWNPSVPSGLRIFDISNPANPILVGSYNTPGGVLEVVVVGSYAYLADRASGLQIFDVSNPTNPMPIGSYDTPGSAYGLTVVGNYAYVADHTSGLHILDVSNPASPVLISSYDTHGDAYGVTVADSYAYVADDTALLIFSTSSKDDLSVGKAAQVNGVTVQQVNPGQIFNYNITVANKGLFNDAPLVVVTDKLPSDVEYLGAEVYPAAPQDYTINQSGDLVYVRFDQIPAASTRYINITVRAPTNAPTTLYNIVNLRYRNDQNQSDNSMTLATYVPQLGYNQTEAAFSFEDLLHNQSQLLFQFEDLLHTIPSNSSTNYSFLVSFEQLLRSQAALTSSFEDLLSNESSTGWDGEYSEENRTALLWSYEQMLYDEAFLFASFNAKLNESWNSLCGYTRTGHTQDAQTELVASFEDLLKRQTRLYKSFNLLLNKIDITSHRDMIDFLAAYENLLRVEANLLMSFNELLETKCSYSAYVCSQGCEYSSIQAAVDAANPGDIIYIAEGIYEENVHIDKSLTIKGADANATIIDGNSAGTVIDIGRNNPNTDVTLSGMTILDGSGTLTDYYGNGDPQLCGGGISNFGSTNINDCNIGTPSNPNTAKYGGGISNFGTLTVTNSNISGNQVSSQGAGGAIFNEGDQAQMTITDSTIFDNSAYWGAGIWTADGAAATVIRCKILNNYAFYNGGGICNAASSLAMAPLNLLNLIDSQISGNHAGIVGGGITNSGATAIVTGSAITGNQASSVGGGIYNQNYYNGVDDVPATITLTNNRISENSASVGGGIYGSGALLPDPFDWTQVYNNSPPP